MYSDDGGVAHTDGRAIVHTDDGGVAHTDGRAIVHTDDGGVAHTDGAWTAVRPIRAAGTLMIACHQRRSVNDPLADHTASDALTTKDG